MYKIVGRLIAVNDQKTGALKFYLRYGVVIREGAVIW